MSLLSIHTATETANSILSYFSKEIKGLSGDEFRLRLRQARRPRLIDVGSSDEYIELHIPGSEHHDLADPDFVDKLEHMERNRPYFIYCRDGIRSEAAIRLMEEMGFKKVYSLLSGLQSWKGTLERSY